MGCLKAERTALMGATCQNQHCQRPQGARKALLCVAADQFELGADDAFLGQKSNDSIEASGVFC